MEVRKVSIDGKEFEVKELLAIDVDSIDFEDKKTAIKKQVMLSTGLTEEQYNQLTLKQRLKLLQAISELNGLNDFISPPK